VQDWEKALQDLREQFIRGAPERFVRIALALESLEADKANGEALRALRAEFHGMSGLGGTYRFPRVTALGLEGEERCDAFLSSGSPPERADVEAWRSLLEGLRGEVGGAMAGKPADRAALEAAPRVLLVTNDREEEAFFRSVLESAGYEVRSVGQVEQWEMALKAFAADLVLLSASLPEDSPRSLRGHLPPAGGRAAAPILFLTTREEREDLPHAAAGDGHLVKPVSPGLLLSTVAALIEKANRPVSRQT
jgi:CheY-like chemotaxis protein